MSCNSRVRITQGSGLSDRWVKKPRIDYSSDEKLGPTDHVLLINAILVIRLATALPG